VLRSTDLLEIQLPIESPGDLIVGTHLESHPTSTAGLDRLHSGFHQCTGNTMPLPVGMDSHVADEETTPFPCAPQ
jgi:hypothetical protein